ncbi:MAG: acetylglutamate kinase [Gemmatimonadaceae bacterium]|jgi:acetylglutamate kinase|nr:acetylglutamate kinase [Gemmatimonadaceae bacterium]MCC6430949.1 acetylglutamate kinase [Gemmatimonadaceae bacterium]
MIVVKLGGRTQSDPALPSALAHLWSASGGQLVIVHGGGDQISALQRLRGEEPVFVGGRRVTTEGVLELVRMVLSGLANKQLVSALTMAGAPAVGISGEDAALLRAVPIDVAVFGFAGTPTRVDRRVIDALLAQSFLPVISPVATHDDQTIGGALNVNGDDAAAAIAAALGADELFLLADVAGVLDDTRARIPVLTLDAARELVASGVAAGGMAAKLDASAHALAGGVGRVRIGDLAALSVPDAGTSIVADRAQADAQVVAGAPDDVSAVVSH